MLKSLNIENIAVIEKAEIEFSSGFNALTGETGAGKSILVDSISAVLGERTSKELVRNGADSAYVSAVFEDIEDDVKEKLEEYDVPIDEEDSLIISRKISSLGKSSCKINGNNVTVSMLRELGMLLVNIHGQHDSQALLNPDYHFKFLDMTGKNEDILESYKNSFKELVSIRKHLKSLTADADTKDRELEILEYQIKEIEGSEIKIGEIEELNEERRVLMNVEKVTSQLHKAKNTLDGNASIGVVDMLDDVVTSLQKASDLNPSLEELFNRVNDIYYELQDCSNTLSDSIDEIEENPYRLEEVEQRLDLLNKLIRKYGSDEEEVLKFLSEAKAELNKLLKFDENADELKQRCEQAEKLAKAAADKLSESRYKTARKFEKSVKEEMVFLDMPNVELVVSQNDCGLRPNGQDDIEILISANPGEEPKSVSKIASGGELSRMMLAIKTVLASSDLIDTLIFDEVDTGISGSAAQKVGMKLKEVSKSRQVLCVTHQAQIAALADSHFLISKDVKDNRTYTDIKLLDYDGRLKELARILGGVDITDTALAHAEKLMNYN